MKPTDFAYRLSGFFSSYLQGMRGASDNTLKSYRDTFAIFLRFCNTQKNMPVEKISIDSISKELVEEFLVWIETVRKSSVSTRNQRLAALHSFFRYVQTEDPQSILACQQILSIPSKKAPKPMMSYLSLEGMRLVLEQPDTESPSEFRDLVLLCLLYDTGARAQELAKLTAGDVNLNTFATIKLHGKGGKVRLVPIMEQTANMLGQYIRSLKLDQAHKKSELLFANRMQGKLTTAGIAYIINKYVERARIQNLSAIPESISPHSFRHSKAMHLLQSDVNLVYIRDFLGHSDIKTTEIYARADAETKRKALVNAHNSISSKELPVWKQDDSLFKWLTSLGK